MILIDGHKIASAIRKEILEEVALLVDNHDITPHVAYVSVTDDELSFEHEAILEKSFHELGFLFSSYRNHEHITEKALLEVINFINIDDEIDGILLQLPMPAHIQVENVINAMAEGKDVSCLHPANILNSVGSIHTFQAALPNALLQIIKRHKLDFSGKVCHVVEKHRGSLASIVALMSELCEVKIYTSTHENIEQVYATADILILNVDAVGSISAANFKQDSVVVDMGYHKLISKKTASGFEYKGDVKIDEQLKKCSHLIVFNESIQPLLSTAVLLNLLKAKRRNLN